MSAETQTVLSSSDGSYLIKHVFSPIQFKRRVLTKTDAADDPEHSPVGMRSHSPVVWEHLGSHGLVLFYHIAAAAAAKTRCLFNLALSCGLRISLAFYSSKMSIYQRLIRVCKELPFSSSCPWFLFYWPPYHSATSCFQLSFHHHFWSRNRKQATDLGLQTHV